MCFLFGMTVQKIFCELQNISLVVIEMIRSAVKVITLENMQEHDNFALAAGHPENGKVFNISIYHSDY